MVEALHRRLDETGGTVRRLDDRLVDKIAAGEVVERPASVVKELVENALDAGASSVAVTIEGAGLGLIRVADDGAGMSAADLPLAISRHCTSKLCDDAGLSAITTMGFRGEALPSIGAVGRLALTSRQGTEAHQIRVEGGRAGPVTPAARAQGTTVEVRDLFFATPARLKFMKSERTEAAAIADTVRRLALSAPAVAFRLETGGRPLSYPAAGAAERARDVLGAEFAQEAIVLAAERDGVRLTGHLGLPTAGRATSQHQYAMVNGRVVRDKLIAQALRAGYMDVMTRDRHPMAVLSLTLNPTAVDVNVHPAKADVRFRDPQGVRGFIVSAIRRALADAVPRASRGVANAALAALADRPASPPATGFAESPARWTVSRPPPPAAMAIPTMPSARVEEPAAPHDHPLGAAVGQLHGNYIVAQTADGVVIVDQHAAHERIVYEELKRSAATAEPAAQGLLIPEVVELDPNDVARLGEHLETLAALGLTLEPFGPGAVVVRETPAALRQFDIAKLVRDLADEVAEWGAAGSLEQRLDHVAATMACHGSVRSGRHLRAEEMNALLRQIETTPSAGQCNHGRPTLGPRTLAEIARLFERR